MTVSARALFESTLGRDRVIERESDPGAASDAARDSAEPLPVARPRNEEEVSALLRACAADRVAVHLEGGGGCPYLGRPPGRIDGIVSLRGISRIVEHAPGDLVLTVEGGATIASIDAALETSRQFLPFDVGDPSRATIGGVAASRAAGPTRLLYGAPRDRLLGISFVDGEGVVRRAGGRVVKNVAGFDLMKLLVGSAGTLGAIVETTWKLEPRPERRESLVLAGDSIAALDRFLRAYRRTPGRPAFLEAMNAAQGRTLGLADPPGVPPSDSRPPVGASVEGIGTAAPAPFLLAVGMDGYAEEVEAERSRVLDLAARNGLEPASKGRHGEDDRAFRAALARGPLDEVVVELHAPPGRLLGILADSWLFGPGSEPNRVKAVAPVEGLRMQARAGSGIAILSWPDRGVDAIGLYWHLLGPVKEAEGHLRVLRGSAELRRGAGAWETSPGGLAIARRLKASFDPKGILAPGRVPGER